MNFFTSLAQLRHGFGGGAEALKDTTATAPEVGSTDFQFDAPAYKASLDLEPPAPILDDAAIMARAALAAQAVADAAEVEYAKHAHFEDDYDEAPEAYTYDTTPADDFEPDADLSAELDQPLDAFEPETLEDIADEMASEEYAETMVTEEITPETAPEVENTYTPRPEPEPFLSAQEYYAPGMDAPIADEAAFDDFDADAPLFDENAFVTEVPHTEPDMPVEEAPALEDTLIADMLAQDAELDAPAMEDAPQAEVAVEPPLAAPTAPVSIETFELAFDAQDASPVLMIEDFDPTTDTLEIELIREPGDDRDLHSTDMALFLNHDGAYGADIVLRMSDSVCSTLRLVGEDDIDLEAVQIEIANAAA